MIDLHTHILPGMDDGAKTPAHSLQMLQAQRAQGIDVVALTPHFYRHKERPEQFLQRRAAAAAALEAHLQRLPREERTRLPQRIVGCEVTWYPGLQDCEYLSELCIGQSSCLLLELPFTPWDDQMSRQIYTLMERTGITPVFAHLERYLKLQSAARVREILSLGAPVQISADGFLSLWTRGKSFRALENWAHIIASDCHNMEKRPPCLGQAMAVVEKKLGAAAVHALDSRAREILDLQAHPFGA